MRQDRKPKLKIAEVSQQVGRERAGARPSALAAPGIVERRHDFGPAGPRQAATFTTVCIVSRSGRVVSRSQTPTVWGISRRTLWPPAEIQHPLRVCEALRGGYIYVAAAHGEVGKIGPAVFLRRLASWEGILRIENSTTRDTNFGLEVSLIGGRLAA